MQWIVGKKNRLGTTYVPGTVPVPVVERENRGNRAGLQPRAGYSRDSGPHGG